MLRTDVAYVDREGKLTQAGFQALGASSGPVVVPDGDYGAITITGGVWAVDPGAVSLDNLSDVVLTAPANGQLLSYNGTNWVNTTPAASGGVTFLGSITTTSGASQSLSSLDLTPYRFLRLTFVGVSTNSASWLMQVDGLSIISPAQNAAATLRGIMDIDLTNGVFSSQIGSAGTNASTNGSGFVGDTAITTASTSVTVSTSAGAFDAGSVRVYGIA